MLRIANKWTGPALLAALLLAALAACSANELAPQEPLRPGDDAGIVILSLNRSGQRDFNLYLWLDGPGQWAPRPIALQAFSRARDWKGGDARDTTPRSEPEGRVVVLKLRPGDYRIGYWNGESHDGGFFGDGYDVKSSDVDLRFTVRSGTVSYLGSVHVQLPKELNWLANLSEATYRLSVDNQRERDLALVRDRYTDLPAGDAIAKLDSNFPAEGKQVRYYVFNRKADNAFDPPSGP